MKISKKTILILVLVLFTLGGIFLVDTIINSIRKEPEQITTGVEKALKQGSEGLVEEENIPDSFPDDFPVYPEAEFDTAYSFKGDEEGAVSIIWIAKGTVEEVFDYYITQLESRGWSIEIEPQDEESFVFLIERGDIHGFVGIGVSDSNTVFVSVTTGADFKTPSL